MSIEDLLKRHSQEGQLIGEGSFSLNLEKSRKKVAEFGFESPEDALLRIIQLVYPEQPSSTSIYIGKDTIDLHFHGVRAERMALAQLITQVEEPGNNLALALQACLCTGFSSGWVGDRSAGWVFDEKGFSAIDRSLLPGVLTIHLKLAASGGKGFWQRIFSLAKARGIEHKVLHERLRYCPKPVRIDGYSFPLAPAAGVPQYFLGGPRSLKVQGLTRPKDGPKPHILEAELCHWGLSGAQGSDILLAHLWVSRAPVCFVAQGVIVGEFQIPYSIWGGIVWADSLQLDASGLRLVKNSRLQSLLAYLRTTSGAFQDTLRTER